MSEQQAVLAALVEWGETPLPEAVLPPKAWGWVDTVVYTVGQEGT